MIYIYTASSKKHIMHHNIISHNGVRDILLCEKLKAYIKLAGFIILDIPSP